MPFYGNQLQPLLLFKIFSMFFHFLANPRDLMLFFNIGADRAFVNVQTNWTYIFKDCSHAWKLFEVHNVHIDVVQSATKQRNAFDL